MLRVHRRFIVLRYTASHTASGKREVILYRVAFEGANLIKMSLVTTAAMLAICLLALVETANTAEATPSGENGKIAFLESPSSGHSGQWGIYTVDPDGSNVRLLIPSGSVPKWSPDGTEILFGTGNGIAATSADGSNWRTITNANESDPTWSADG